jgi:hypothetical protein
MSSSISVSGLVERCNAAVFLRLRKAKNRIKGQHDATPRAEKMTMNISVGMSPVFLSGSNSLVMGGRVRGESLLGLTDEVVVSVNIIKHIQASLRCEFSVEMH